MTAKQMASETIDPILEFGALFTMQVNNEPKLRLGKVLPCVLDIENRTLPNCREHKVSVLKLFVRIRVQALRQLQIAVRVNPQNQDQRASSEEDSRGIRNAVLQPPFPLGIMNNPLARDFVLYIVAGLERRACRRLRLPSRS